MHPWIIIFVTFLLPLPCLFSADDPLNLQAEFGGRSLRINVICSANGVGQGKDLKILKEEISQLGHEVQHIPYTIVSAYQEADINIFIEHFDPVLFSYAKRNCLIPNPEWYCSTAEWIPQFDLILCRTREVERIFKEQQGKTYFLGFTSCDHYCPEISKDYSQYFHLRGQALGKGTDAILIAWKERPDFPVLTLLSHWAEYSPLPNLSLHQYYMSQEELIYLQNHCGVHILPSQTEGFGHSISEAMACGAVVLTTDAPPMNEFITDPNCLIGYICTAHQRLAINYTADPKKIESCVEQLMTFSDDDLVRIGQENRQRYLQNKADFRNNLERLFGKAATK